MSQTPEVQFPVTNQQERLIMQMPPRMSVVEAVPFKQAFQDLYAQSPFPTQVILDFHQTTFIDSSGIGALVSNLKTIQRHGGGLTLRGVRSPVMAVFAMTGLDALLTFEAEPDQAAPSPAPREAEIYPTHPSVRSWLKRLIDIVGALTGLGITAVLLLPIAIAIKLDSPGPIFFGQVRCGWMGKRFRIWKFRSMCTDAEARKAQVRNELAGPLFKNANDPRVTKVGRFLRRTSLDELPQFWNVLRGEMSLVGTRPPTPDEVERYEVPEWQRLDVKPGMTGEWQVNGRSQIRDFEDVIRLDLRYQQNWSLLYDIKLILKTIAIVFNRRSGAV